MIDITGIDLVEFAKKVYELSVPQGMGILHYTPEPLSDKVAKQLVRAEGSSALSMDYVSGRACKMHVRRENGKLTISDTWYDHTDRIYTELLDSFGIKRQSDSKHGCACNCIDCQSVRVEGQS